MVIHFFRHEKVGQYAETFMFGKWRSRNIPLWMFRIAVWMFPSRSAHIGWPRATEADDEDLEF